MKLTYYYLSFILGLVGACAINAVTAKAGKKSVKLSLSYTVTGFVCALPGTVIMAQIFNFTMRQCFEGQRFSPSTMALYGGLLFMPLIILIPVKIIKADFSEVTDIAAPGVFLLLSIAKTGCAVYGCCYGIECTNGIYSSFSGKYAFPVQLLETAVYALVAVLLSLYSVKCKKRKPGTVYPLGLAVYGLSRFFIQFLRAHEIPAEADFLWFMDFWQVVSVIAIVTGVVWFALANRKRHTAG